MRYLLAFSLLFASVICAQDEKKQAPAGVTQKEIDDAIWRGVAYLKLPAPSPGGHLNTDCDELIFLTLIHAGVSEKDEYFKKLLGNVMERPLKHTYKVALLAMCLEELDRVTCQNRIWQCAQFLVDNQAKNGQWSYGSPTEYKDMPAGEPTKRPVASETRERGGVREFETERVKPKVVRKLLVQQKRTGGESGDNSNSQYASLGLRACHDAGIVIPDNVLQLARKWWVESQHPDESGKPDAGKGAVSTGGDVTTKIQGWNYQKPAERGGPTHAMTAGAVGATVIYEYLLGRDWRKDVVTKAGVNWLGAHFSVNENYYYMYALERAGMLYGTETFGAHNWYLEGARFLLNHQNADGSWGKRENKDQNTWDTCFAILFLKRATRAIATEGSRKR